MTGNRLHARHRPSKFLPVTLPQFTAAGSQRGVEGPSGEPGVLSLPIAAGDGERESADGASGRGRVNPPLPPSPLARRRHLLLLPSSSTTSCRRRRRRRRRRRCLPYPKPERNQSRNPHSADAHRGDGSVATLQLASVSVLASYSGGLRPRVYRVCVYRRG